MGPKNLDPAPFKIWKLYQLGGTDCFLYIVQETIGSQLSGKNEGCIRKDGNYMTLTETQNIFYLILRCFRTPISNINHYCYFWKKKLLGYLMNLYDIHMLQVELCPPLPIEILVYSTCE